MFSQVQTQEVKANTMYWCFGSRGTNASGQDELHVMNTLLCIRLITDVLVCIWLFHLVHLQKYSTSSLLKIEFNIQETADILSNIHLYTDIIGPNKSTSKRLL